MEISYLYLQNLFLDKGSPSKHYDLVLYLHEELEGGQMQWLYYYVCHKTRTLFWVHDYNAMDILSEVFWVGSPTHVSASPISSSSCRLCLLIRFSEHRLEALYWCFCRAELDLNCIN